MKKFIFHTLALVTCMVSTLIPMTSPLEAQEATPTVTPTPSDGRVWTLEEIIAEPIPALPKGKTKYCHGGRFQPCVCPEYVSRAVKYRPAVQECNGNAGILFGRKYTGIYSAVVRDGENRDRWPLSGFGGCNPYERDTLGLNKCSAFKVQDIVKIKPNGDPYALHCLGASGYSTLFSKVRRITVKLSDSPNSNNDPLVRWCLKKPGKPLN